MPTSELKVLAVGRHAGIMEVMNRLLNAKEGRVGKTVLSDAAALEAVQAETFHIVLLCGGISTPEEAALKAGLLSIDPSLIIARHYGGGSGLLENELLQALAQRL